MTYLKLINFSSWCLKPVDKNGHVYSVSKLTQKENSTEALAYLNNVTYATIDIFKYGNRLEYVKAAPGLHFKRNITMQKLDINYQVVCRSFLTMGSLMNDGENLIPRLCCDILFYFVNDPIFQTEAILDSLIETVNIDRQNRNMPDARMPESAITIAPNQPRTFQQSLHVMKEIFENISKRDTNEMTAMPNGLRITINVVVADPRAPPDAVVEDMYNYNFDYGEDNVELILNNIAQLQIESYYNSQEGPLSHYIPFNYKNPPRRGGGKNIKKRRSRKKRKYKRTIKSKKNKTKLNRTKRNLNLKKYKITKNKKKSKKIRKK